MVKDTIRDGGYGALDNFSLLLFLETLSDEVRKGYEEHLKKQNKEQYNQYKEWEKEYYG